MNSRTTPLWYELTRTEQEEFLSIHTGDQPGGEIRLDELLNLARKRKKDRDSDEG